MDTDWLYTPEFHGLRKSIPTDRLFVGAPSYRETNDVARIDAIDGSSYVKRHGFEIHVHWSSGERGAGDKHGDPEQIPFTAYHGRTTVT